jgi:hypothetical protein
MRVVAILTLLAGAGGTYAVFNLSQINGAESLALPGILTVVVGVLLMAFAAVYALVLWGFADGLVLLADLDDAQRLTQRSVADLILAARTARGPFHAEVAGAKPPEGSQPTA